MIRNATAATAAASLLLGASLSACGGSSPAPFRPRAEAPAYLRAHPVPARPGMVAAIVLTSEVTAFMTPSGKWLTWCPARLTASTAGQVVGPPCGSWAGTAEMPGGSVMRFSCGSVVTEQSCPVLRANDVSTPGDYVYLPADGQISGLGDIRDITVAAVGSILLHSPDHDLRTARVPAGHARSL